jgi:hypothetical protein
MRILMKQNTFSSLPAPHQRLVRLMQEIGFGHIDNLMIRDGLPIFDPPPRVIVDIKFGADNGPHTQLANPEFALKQSIADLIAQLAQIGTGMVVCLMVRHGLPFSMNVEMAVIAACQTLG